jgi:hypothetical protein
MRCPCRVRINFTQSSSSLITTFRGLKIKHGARLPNKKKKKNAFLSFLEVLFKTHPIKQRKAGALNKLIEQFWKIVNAGFSQNVKTLHIKVSQTKFQRLL